MGENVFCMKKINFFTRKRESGESFMRENVCYLYGEKFSPCRKWFLHGEHFFTVEKMFLCGENVFIWRKCFHLWEMFFTWRKCFHCEDKKKFYKEKFFFYILKVFFAWRCFYMDNWIMRCFFHTVTPLLWVPLGWITKFCRLGVAWNIGMHHSDSLQYFWFFCDRNLWIYASVVILTGEKFCVCFIQEKWWLDVRWLYLLV